MTVEEINRAAILKVLGEPVFLGFDEPAQKARRNLITVGTVAIAFWAWDLKVAKDPSILGVQVQNVAGSVFAWGLLWALGYLIVHFVWLGWDAFVEWRLRITGTRVVHVTTARASSVHGDYPSDPRQSTLYGWWADQTRSIGKVSQLVEDLRAAISLMPAPPHGYHDFASTLASQLANLAKQVENSGKLIADARIPVSLERFDSWNRLFLKSQNMRWLLLELGVPLAVGLGGVAAAICMVASEQGSVGSQVQGATVRATVSAPSSASAVTRVP
jgi:hypothetical protein